MGFGNVGLLSMVDVWYSCNCDVTSILALTIKTDDGRSSSPSAYSATAYKYRIVSLTGLQ